MFWAPIADVKGRRPVYIGKSHNSVSICAVIDVLTLQRV